MTRRLARLAFLTLALSLTFSVMAQPVSIAQPTPDLQVPDHQWPAIGRAKSAPTMSAQAAAEVLPINHTCSSTLRIRAQELTATQLSATCASLAGQDAFFHIESRDPGPIPGDLNTTLEVVVFNSSADYRQYAGSMFGIDTNNGGMYLEGEPTRAGNVPRFIAYETGSGTSWQIWNLNHEYTHYLDGRFNMYGPYLGDNVPVVWWVEGFAEYISYHYRNVTYTSAINEARTNRYALSTLFDTVYGDPTRTYVWGYLAVRYMLQSHRADVNTVLGYYRSGNWSAARTFLKTTIGTRYDADFRAWTTQCGNGNCGPTTPPPPPTGCGPFTNGTNVTIPDNATVESSVNVTGCTGTASTVSTVEVHIVHTYIGDLLVSLVAPDGSTYILHNRADGDTANLNRTYSVNLSSETRNGAWKLRVNDNWVNDTGYIDTWTLRL